MADVGLTTSQRDAVKQISPPWLCQGTGEKLLYSLGLASDVLLEKMNQAMRGHMPKYCDSTCLPYIGNDRLLTQGPAETDAAFRVRLQTAFDAWQRAGSRRSVLQQSLGYVAGLLGTTSGTVPAGAIVSSSGSTWATWDTYYNTSDTSQPPAHVSITGSNWNWDGNYVPWQAFLILYFQSNATIGAGPVFGAAGKTIGDASVSIGFNTPAATWNVLRQIVQLWKSDGAYYPFFIINLGGSTGVTGSEFSPNSAQGSGNPDGTWGSWAKTVNGVMVASRASDSRYVDGTGVLNIKVASVPISS